MPTETQIVVEPEPRRRRSVFGNYEAPVGTPDGSAQAGEGDSPPPRLEARMEGSAELALSRSFVHQWFARVFDYPSADTWTWLCSGEVVSGLSSSIAAIEPDVRAPLRERLDALLAVLKVDAFDAFHNDYITAVGHAARGSCPLNEIEYGDLKADPLFQPHRLADLAAFYRAFGMELGTLADERHDHLSVEMEFMAVLAAQEAGLRSGLGNADGLPVCLDAQRKFLRGHLGRWTPAFARRLARVVGQGALGSLALFALTFIESECRRFGVKTRSEDLVLRPADEGAALCDGCGLSQSLPGAPATQSCA